MVSLETFRKLALDLPEVEEALHFKLFVFGLRKKNFASFDPRSGELSLKLSLTDPQRLEGIGKGILSPVPGKYGTQGWTTVDLERVGKTEFVQLLEAAHEQVAATAIVPVKLVLPPTKSKPKKGAP